MTDWLTDVCRQNQTSTTYSKPGQMNWHLTKNKTEKKAEINNKLFWVLNALSVCMCVSIFATKKQKKKKRVAGHEQKTKLVRKAKKFTI